MTAIPSHRGVAINVRGNATPPSPEQLEVACRVPLTAEEKLEITNDASIQPHYADLRRAEYPSIGDQLDAILKALNYLQLRGTNLPSEADAIISKWLNVKKKHPKA